jgi:hypothetical protein
MTGFFPLHTLFFFFTSAFLDRGRGVSDVYPYRYTFSSSPLLVCSNQPSLTVSFPLSLVFPFGFELSFCVVCYRNILGIYNTILGYNGIQRSFDVLLIQVIPR